VNHEFIITAQELKHSLQLGAPIARSTRNRFGSDDFATRVGQFSDLNI
jgi:hypothetical protein